MTAATSRNGREALDEYVRMYVNENNSVRQTTPYITGSQLQFHITSFFSLSTRTAVLAAFTKRIEPSFCLPER